MWYTYIHIYIYIYIYEFLKKTLFLHIVALYDIKWYYIITIYIWTDWNLECPGFPKIFDPEDRTWPISGGFGSNLESPVMISLYFGECGSKFQSVNTKTSQFCQFFGLQELRKHMSTPKLVNFPHFSDSRSYIYIYINMYICTYVYYMILLHLESSGSKFQSVNTKTSQFSPFFGFQELRKNSYIYFHVYITWFCYI